MKSLLACFIFWPRKTIVDPDDDEPIARQHSCTSVSSEASDLSALSTKSLRDVWNSFKELCRPDPVLRPSSKLDTDVINGEPKEEDHDASFLEANSRRQDSLKLVFDVDRRINLNMLPGRSPQVPSRHHAKSAWTV